MNLFGFELSMRREKKGADTFTLNDWIARMDSLLETAAGVTVTPETAMESPTVQAVVKAISGRMAITPFHVYKKTSTAQGEKKELQPNHPVNRLLQRPSVEGVSRVSMWSDAASWFVRYGNYYAVKGQGITGPVRKLFPVAPNHVEVAQQDDFSLVYRIRRDNGSLREYRAADVVHARGPARNGYRGDSPIYDIRQSIALEIAAERMGASFFGNGGLPSIMFQFLPTYTGNWTKQQKEDFLNTFYQAYANKGRFRAMMLPKGVDWKDVPVDNDKAQFLATRQFQRTVIAGGLGVPPHLVGDLQKATYNNVEQQSIDFILTVVLPVLREFEAALERDLLSPSDLNSGLIIRANLDAALRGDFKTRQEGLNIQRQAGVISANEWREREGMNPRAGGDTYYEQGPSGQTSMPAVDAPDSGTPNDTPDLPDENAQRNGHSMQHQLDRMGDLARRL